MDAMCLIGKKTYLDLRGLYNHVISFNNTGDKQYQGHKKAFFKKVNDYHDELKRTLISDFEDFYKDRKDVKPKAPNVKKRDDAISIKLDRNLDFTWKQARYIAFIIYGNSCSCCGRSPEIDVTVSVDHIKPKSLFPQLETDIRNLQILCEECNQGKCNWDETDWRTEEQKFKAIHVTHFPKSIYFYNNTSYNA